MACDVLNSDLTSFWHAKEQTYAVPDPTATLIPVRRTQETLQRNSEFTESAELTPDAQVADQIRVNIGASGTISFELSHGSFESLISSVFRQEAFTPQGGTLSVTGDGVADLDFAAAGQTISRAAGDFVADGFERGMRVSVTGSASNDGSYVLAAVSALSLTVETGSGIVDEANVAATVAAGATYTASTLSLASVDNSLNDSANGFVDAGFVAGQWITLSGTAADDDLYKVASVAAGKLVLSHGTVADEAAGSSITATSERYVENGTRFPTHTFERRYEEATDPNERYVQFRGCGLDTMSLEVSPESIITGEFGVIGSDEVDGAGATFGAGDAAASTTRVLDAVGGVEAVFEDGTAFAVTNFSFEIANGAEPLSEVGNLGAICVAAGKFRVTGSLTIFYRNKAFFSKYLDNTETSLALKFRDGAGNVDVIDMPAAILTDGTRAPGATDTRVQGVFSFGLKKDAVEGKSMRWISVDA